MRKRAASGAVGAVGVAESVPWIHTRAVPPVCEHSRQRIQCVHAHPRRSLRCNGPSPPSPPRHPCHGVEPWRALGLAHQTPSALRRRAANCVHLVAWPIKIACARVLRAQGRCVLRREPAGPSGLVLYYHKSTHAPADTPPARVVPRGGRSGAGWRCARPLADHLKTTW